MTEATPHDDPRGISTEELLKELMSWSAKDRLNALRVWHAGSLSLIHLHVLTVLEANGPMAMGELAEALDVSVASATGLISRMVERGLVERRHDETDRRVVVVKATEAGANVFREMEQRRRAGLEALMAKLTDEEQAGFLAGLRALTAARRAAAAAGSEAAAQALRSGSTPSQEPAPTRPLSSPSAVGSAPPPLTATSEATR
jgi:DNA-binding MarR family transcriptional regulator